MPSPEETTKTAHAFLADHPETEDLLEELVERDARGEPWTFDEIDLDSGQFGELVSHDLATSVEDGYRLVHPDAISAALETFPDDRSESTATGVVSTAESEDTANGTTSTIDSAERDSTANATLRSLADQVQKFGLPNADRWTVAGLIGTLLAVTAARLVAAPDVLRDGYVVSPANDTYFFRYWQENLAARADSFLDFALFADMGGAASTRPLSHAINWWVTVFFGGVDAAPAVAAWLPVVAAVMLGYVVYRITRLLTSDTRIALAAVLFYGLAPANAVYTSVGFLDHQAHQYLWLGLLVLGLTALAVDVARRASETDPKTAAATHAYAPRSWMIAGGLAVAVAASAHLWGGSPLTFIPVAAVVGFRAALDVRHDAAPALGAAPTIVGLALGALLAIGAHLWLGWHESIAAVTPALVAGGAIVVVALAEGWRRTDLPAAGLVGLEVVVAVAGLIAYRVARPDDVARFRTRAGDLFFREGATETVSLFSPDFAVVFGPLLQLGLGFYLAIGVLVAATWGLARRYEPGWLVVVCFAWYYILLATIQVRFAGQLAIVIAPFAGIGLLYVLAAIDIARPVDYLGRAGARARDDTTNAGRRSLLDRVGGDDADISSDGLVSSGTSRITPQLPDGTRVRGYLVAAVAFVLLFNLVLVPPLVGQTTHDQAQFDAAMTVDAHADTVDREYPQNFVLSQWGDNRMYNYFVSGESQSYGYAQSNHESFVTAEDPDGWYDRFHERVGYVVLTERSGNPPANSTYGQLYEGYGVGVNDTVATGHYQLLTADEGVRTFALVPGATLRVTGQNGERVTASTPVSIGDETAQYAREGAVSEGVANVRVAHPGEYTIGNRTVTVSAEAVVTGSQVNVTG
ncbi:hypothetical protein [Halorubrum amylolyticum]|uniref:hypothetical protein n=1 Tax=Halorubrum amylolyticum TaxID=2508724 RepID=UPI001008DE5E|nr:hypothetical protein [Halorubrum amylolyticum]